MEISSPMRVDVSMCVALANFDSKFVGYWDKSSNFIFGESSYFFNCMLYY